VISSFQRAIFYGCGPPLSYFLCSGSRQCWISHKKKAGLRPRDFETRKILRHHQSTDQRDRFELLYPCSRLQHSPRSFPTYITTVETHRELFWSLHFHFTTMLKRQPNWDPTTRWHLSIWHVDWVPKSYDGVTVDISLEHCNMAKALQIFRIQIAISGPVLLDWWWCQEWKDDKMDTCGTLSRSRGMQERCFRCITVGFWDHHYVSLDMWT
jgi:hypothetical protein